LADARWRAVHMTPSGWRIVDRPPVLFRRSQGMLALPDPAAGGALDGLREVVRGTSDDHWRLYEGGLADALPPAGPVPRVRVGGEHGGGKSTAAKVFKRMIDPSLPLLRACPRDEHDLVIAARNSWVCGFDNVSSLPPWLSDAFCRLSTGGGFGTRQ